jgi:hypothetical protein
LGLVKRAAAAATVGTVAAGLVAAPTIIEKTQIREVVPSQPAAPTAGASGGNEVLKLLPSCSEDYFIYDWEKSGQYVFWACIKGRITNQACCNGAIAASKAVNSQLQDFAEYSRAQRAR